MTLRTRNFRVDKRHHFAREATLLALGACSGGNHFHDSMCGRHGTLTSMEPSDWTAVGGRRGLNFEGGASNEYVDVDNSSGRLLIASDYCTVSFWAKSLVDAVDYQAIFTIHDGTDPVAIAYFRNSENGFTYDWVNEGISSSRPSSSFDETQLHHFAIQFGVGGSSVSKLYIDGNDATKETGVSNLTPPNVSGKLNLGRGYSTLYGNVQIADFAIHKRLLSDLEISEFADPSNIWLSGLVVPPRRRFYPVKISAAAKIAWARQHNTQVIGGGAI